MPSFRPLYLLPNKLYNVIGKIVVIMFILLMIILALPMFKGSSDIFTASTMIVQPFFLLWLWSKERIDNESTTNIRLKAMQIAAYINYGLFLIATWVLYNFEYAAAIFWGLILLPITFLVVFYFLLYRASRMEHPGYSAG